MRLRKIVEFSVLEDFGEIATSLVNDAAFVPVPGHDGGHRGISGRRSGADRGPLGERDHAAGGFPIEIAARNAAVALADVLGIREMLVVGGDHVGPAVDVVVPFETLDEHDLVVTRIGVEKYFGAARGEVLGNDAGAADVQKDVGGFGEFSESLAGHAEVFVVKKIIVPLFGQLRGMSFEKVGQEIDGVIGFIDGGALDGIVRPDPGVFVIDDVVPEFVQAEEVVEIIPGDAAQGELADHPADDDAKFLGFFGHPAAVGCWSLSCCRAMLK